MIFPHAAVAFPSAVIVLGIVYGKQVQSLAENLRLYAHQHIPQAIAYLVRLFERLIKQIRSGMRDWRWKSVLTSRSFNTAP